MFRSTANLYDLIYTGAGKDYPAEVDRLVAEVAARRPQVRSWLDVACGTGRHLELLAAHVDDVAGVDLDENMLAVAAGRCPGVELTVADMRTLDLGRRFDVVSCLFSSIGYVDGVDELHAAVASMGRHVNDGGVLVVDGWMTPEQWDDRHRDHVVVGRDDSTTVVRLAHHRRDDRHTILEMHHLVGTAAGVEHVVDEHHLTLFTVDDYASAFTGAGFSFDVLAAPLASRDRYIGVVAASE